MNRIRPAWLPGLLIFGLCGLTQPAKADMGGIYVGTEDVRVSEDAQKAILLHNGAEEVLILGTELLATARTGLIRFIPFPAEPTVDVAPSGAFERAAAMIEKYGLVFQTWARSKGGAGQAVAEGVELRFHARLGGHDMTVIKVNDVATFRQWVNDYFAARGLPTRPSYPAEEAVIADYVDRGIDYFVTDYVELGTEPVAVAPLRFRFRSERLYYPLRTANTFGGEGAIELVVIAPTTLCAGGRYEYLEAGSRALYGPGPCLGLTVEASTSARVVAEEHDLDGLLADGDSFFKNAPAFIQVIRYRGPYRFDDDVFVDVGKGSPEPFGIMQAEDRGGRWMGQLAVPLGCMPFTDSAEQARCKLKPDPGPCKGLFTRYYFDLEARACRPFFWGGCGGVVPFESEAECRNYADPPIPGR